MGVMRFQLHPPHVAEDCPEIFRAYISGWDGRVFPTRVDINGDAMSCRRPVSDSGRLQVAWPVEGFGRPTLSTTSLPEREEPYILPVELARGKISQIREQVSRWESEGLAFPAEFAVLHRNAYRQFINAVGQQSRIALASQLAGEALRLECEAEALLARSYAQQRLEQQWQRSGQPSALLGCSLERALPTEPETRQFVDTFSAAMVPVAWKQIEPTEGQYNWELSDTHVTWCEREKLTAIGGPLIDLSPNGMPPWLWQWEHDVFNLQSFVCDYVETAIGRYHGRIRTWDVAARANSGGAMTLSEEDRLSVVARALEVARHVDPEIQLMITVDQPWGEYQARGHHRLSPYQFVDALVRSGVGLSTVNLEFGVGYQPRGCSPRDPLAVSQLIDHWGTLGLPLNITLAVPSSADPDDCADSDLEVPLDSPWNQPWSLESQAEWFGEFLPILLAKEAVVGVFASQFSDAGLHHFPHAGLLDANGDPKPALQKFREVRYFGQQD